MEPFVGLSGQTRVFFNVPTKPLAHWPFRRQTTERSEVSPEVILDGLAEDSSVLNQVLWHPGGSRDSSHSAGSLCDGDLSYSLVLGGSDLLSHRLC